jgi:hypothetical protein
MKIGSGSRTVTDPAGTHWRVRRVWLTRNTPRLRRVKGADLSSAGGLPLPDISAADQAEVVLAAIVALVLIVFVVIPLLLFGLELLIVGLVLTVGALGHLLLGRPWVIQTWTADPNGARYEWQIAGWRRSGAAIDQIASALVAGENPNLLELDRRS